MNEVDDHGIDRPTFMLGDWRFTSMSNCGHECNDPVTGLGTTGQCDEDSDKDIVCGGGTDCEDCGVYDMDELFATLAENGCHLDYSITCGGEVGTYTAGCAAVGIEDRTRTGDETNTKYIDPGQASSSCSAGGSSASFTMKYALRDDNTPINMKYIQCRYYEYDLSSRNMRITVAGFRRTLSTPLSSITCPSDASSARVLAIQRPVGTEYYEMWVKVSDVTCTGDCGALMCSSACAPPSTPADEVPIGAIVGGVVGGVVGLALIIGVTVGLICCCKKKNAGSSRDPVGVQMSGVPVATPVATATAMSAKV